MDEFLYLPLYSRTGKIHVAEQSGLNQWNACGRPRNFDEVYIPIPSNIHRSFPHFFPDRNTYFALFLPNKDVIISKVCQDNGKALMSNPNSDLGKWILRDVLNVEQGKLVTYQMLEEQQIDSVVIRNISQNEHENCDIIIEDILQDRNHNIFKNTPYKRLSNEAISNMLYNIVNKRLYYSINTADFGAYEAQLY